MNSASPSPFRSSVRDATSRRKEWKVARTARAAINTLSALTESAFAWSRLSQSIARQEIGSLSRPRAAADSAREFQRQGAFELRSAKREVRSAKRAS
jgi:hypothetical protein